MPDLTGADPRLAQLADQADDLLGGGRPAFEQRLDSLKGLPVIANKWASWCTPCKAEAPILQRAARDYGNRVAFLGINAYDEVNGSEEFRQKFPMPYPSYEDPKFKVSALLPPADKLPVTGFWDIDGKLVGQKYGEYVSLAELEADIKRHFGKLALSTPE